MLSGMRRSDLVKFLEMAGESKNGKGDMAAEEAIASEVTENKKKNPKRGVLSRIWNGLFRLHGDDFEKKLQHISKEETTVLARMKRRSQNWRKMTRQLIIFSVLLEVIAVGYAIMTTRSLDLNWKMRALRVLPMFLLPGLSSVAYSALGSVTRMCDRRDQKTLEKLRAERQAKIDEIKERTNYYATQQLIQRYDPDPAAKAAAATILASKLGADSGLKVVVGDEPPNKLNAPAPTGKSRDVELAQSSGGLRNRKQLQHASTENHQPDEGGMLQHSLSAEILKQDQMVVEHYHQKGSSTHDGGGWVARIAALLVGEDPTQSYALICGNCHMHNGLARKEDFLFITYYCPHCNVLNRPKQLEERLTGSQVPSPTTTTTTDDDINSAMAPAADSSSNPPVAETSGGGESDPAFVPAGSIS